MIRTKAILHSLTQKVLASLSAKLGLRSEGAKRDLAQRLLPKVQGDLATLLPQLSEKDLCRSCRRLDVPDYGRKDTLVDAVLGFQCGEVKTFRDQLRYQGDGPEPRDYQKEAIADVPGRLQPGRPQLIHIATGGGKTLVANDILANFLADGGQALWVTMNWELLWQAAADLSGRHRAYENRLGRLGGSRSRLPLPYVNGGSRVVCTTLHTLHNRVRRDDAVPGVRPRLLVWDEAHWGETGQFGHAIFDWCERQGIGAQGRNTFTLDRASQLPHDVAEFCKTQLMREKRAFRLANLHGC